jgi:hypothetical protein
MIAHNCYRLVGWVDPRSYVTEKWPNKEMRLPTGKEATFVSPLAQFYQLPPPQGTLLLTLQLTLYEPEDRLMTIFRGHFGAKVRSVAKVTNCINDWV